MSGIIAGITVGSIVILIFISFIFHKAIKNYSLNKLTKRLGQSTESIVNNDINIWAKHTKNKYIKTSLYKNKDKKLIKINGILITNKGIIVVKVKSTKGKISGDANADKWIKDTGTNNFFIPNSIKQNDQHIQNILTIINIKVPVISLIIYSNKSETISITNKPLHVVLIRHIEIYDTLDKINSILKTKITEYQIKIIYKMINSYRVNKIKFINFYKK